MQNNGGQERTFFNIIIVSLGTGKNGLAKATDIVNNVGQRYGVVADFKVVLDPTVIDWSEQVGKEFTVYIKSNSYDTKKLHSFLIDLESQLRMNNIANNGFGPNVVRGDKRIAGSNYDSYRYQYTNDKGIPDGVYNNSYIFVAPNAQYGGDIMSEVQVR